MKLASLAIAIGAVVLLAACGEKPQGIGGVKHDSPSFNGTGSAAYTGPTSAFAAPGWKAGDKASWEQQLRSRAQNGQNDYVKVN